MSDWLVYFDKRRPDGARSHEDLIATNVSRRQHKDRSYPSLSQILTLKGRLVKIDGGTRDALSRGFQKEKKWVVEVAFLT